jgi:hypothetical protein
MRQFISVLLTILLLTGCAGMAGKTKSLSDDLGSPEKAALLKERATEFWSAFVKQDYAKVFDMQDPFFRTAKKKDAYMASLGTIRYHKFEIKDVTVEGNTAKVKTRVVFSVPKTKIKQLTVSAPETEREFDDKWLYVYDNWYKEYYSEMVESGIADY